MSDVAGIVEIVAVGGVLAVYAGFVCQARFKARRMLRSKVVSDLPNFIVTLRLSEISRQTDPGNEDSDLVLFDAPDARVLVVVDASEDVNGERQTYWLAVPRSCETAMDAAAWTFGLSTKEYAALAWAS
jgi:hypothetical protein